MSQQSIFRLFHKLQTIPLQKICRELAEEGKQAVDEAYSSAASPGNDEWNTEVKDLPDGASLEAYGESVGFLEFGTGIMTTTDEFADAVGYSVTPGSWSETHEKQFTSKGYWRFKRDDVLSERITGTPPTRGMQQALDRMRESKILIEEVHKWIKGN